ncbi:MAG: TIGR00270 family protein [Thermoprotei archaeon]|nr:MAG: TIGR00270 family protein [Thermoprotei archaeon]RLE90194.1 MAG: TIGR00270 family protein [Thermoprotei archaeon]
MKLYCELCGREIIGVGYRVRIEKSELTVCRICASRYRVVKVIPTETLTKSVPSKRARKIKPKVYRESLLDLELVDDYNVKIKEARERMGLTRELLAQIVGEKESTIRRIEQGVLEPTVELARKLERKLKIKLLKKVEREEKIISRRTLDLTLGDIIVIRERKRGEKSGGRKSTASTEETT